jgi:endonuclease/exonuclease/phosphatase (EEP) superfamily protein YafD
MVAHKKDAGQGQAMVSGQIMKQPTRRAGRMVKSVLRWLMVLALLTLLASYLGALHPLGDSLAVFRWWIIYGVVGIAVPCILTGLRRTGTASLAAAVLASLHLASYHRIPAGLEGDAPDLVIYAKNIGSGRADWDALVADIASVGADTVLLQEVTRAIADALPALLPDHPHQHVCRFSDWSAMVVASRHPLSSPGCTGHRSLAHAVVEAPGGLVWVASIHQVWPYPYEQADLLPGILTAVTPVGARQVIAGDFNMVPWGHSVRQIARSSGTRRISPMDRTIEVRGIGLSIDHVLTDGRGDVTRRPRLGSDHWGLTARIGWD